MASGWPPPEASETGVLPLASVQSTMLRRCWSRTTFPFSSVPTPFLVSRSATLKERVGGLSRKRGLTSLHEVREGEVRRVSGLADACCSPVSHPPPSNLLAGVCGNAPVKRVQSCCFGKAPSPPPSPKYAQSMPAGQASPLPQWPEDPGGSERSTDVTAVLPRKLHL